MSKSFVVAKNVINIYAEPNISSEIISQAILGAMLNEQERVDNFTRVIGEDRYCGWASTRFLTENEAYSAAIRAADCPVVTDLFTEVLSTPDEDAELISRLVISTRVHVVNAPNAKTNSKVLSSDLSELVNINLPSGVSGWIKQSSISIASAVTNMSNWDKSPGQREVLIKMLGERVVATAKRFTAIPYFWGGCTPFGIDCSGLVQLCYKIEGVQLLRDTCLQIEDKRFTQIEHGISLDKAQFHAGDVIFFGQEDNRGGGVRNRHVGIACGDGRFIHASGRELNFGVYIDSCSEPFYVERYMKALRLSPSVNLAIDNA